MKEAIFNFMLAYDLAMLNKYFKKSEKNTLLLLKVELRNYKYACFNQKDKIFSQVRLYGDSIIKFENTIYRLISQNYEENNENNSWSQKKL